MAAVQNLYTETLLVKDFRLGTETWSKNSKQESYTASAKNDKFFCFVFALSFIELCYYSFFVDKQRMLLWPKYLSFYSASSYSTAVDKEWLT